MPTTNSTDDHKRQMFGQIMKRELALFQRDGNGVYAWMIYAGARAWKVDVPEAVLEYFDQCARQLTSSKGTKSSDTIAETLGLATTGGGPTARTRAVTTLRDHAIVDAVVARLTAPDAPLDELVFAEVADQCKLSISRVSNIYYRYTRKRTSSPPTR